MTRQDIIKEMERKAADLSAAGDHWYKVRYTTGAEFYNKAREIRKTIQMLKGE